MPSQKKNTIEKVATFGKRFKGRWMSLTDKTTYRKYKTRAMLKKKSYTDSWFLTSNGGSPYRGCEHGCIYCDGRARDMVFLFLTQRFRSR